MDSSINSTAGFYQRSVDQMAGLRRSAEGLQAQISTGERLSAASDDPVAAASLRRLSRMDRLAEVDSTNAARASSDLQLADGALQTIANDFARARELAVYAGTGSLSPDQRAIVGVELAAIQKSLLGTINIRGIGGNALFAGQGDGPAYVTDAAGNAAYTGTGAASTLALGEGLTVTAGITGPEALGFANGGVSTDMLAFIKGLADTLQDTALDGAAAARASLGGFDEGLEALTRAQTAIGVRMAWIETVQVRHADNSEARAQEATSQGGVDLATTISNLQQTLTVLEASQAGFVRIGQLSLFNSI